MCTIIVTIRTVLWAVMTIAGSLMILVSLFTDRWLIGSGSPGSIVANVLNGNGAGVTDVFKGGVTDVFNGRAPDDMFVRGIFLECVKPEGARVSSVNNK